MLLAAATLTGTLVRRMARTPSWRAFLFGAAACLFLAPLPWIPGPLFGSWAMGLIFGITFYGLARSRSCSCSTAVALLRQRASTWALAAFVGSAVAFILPAHIVIAVLGLVGVGNRLVHPGRAVAGPRTAPADIPLRWRRTFLAAGIALIATVVWGLMTGHGLGGTTPPSSIVAPFNASWAESIGITVFGAGSFLAIPFVGFLARRRWPDQVDMYVGTLGLLVVGAIAWGARLGDFNMFHTYFAGIAVFATPAASVAIWALLKNLRDTGHLRIAGAVVVICGAQLVVCAAFVLPRFQQFGPRD